jgi:hypothetical protein
MPNKSKAFRVGKVRGYLRGRVWYLCYHEHGRRRRPRVGPDREAARQLAAQVNAQVEVDAAAALRFEPVTVPELRRRWLDHHEQDRRSSVQTLDRYRTATNHLLRHLEPWPVRHAARRRHLSTYAENPFAALEIDRIPVEQARPIALFSAEQEHAFLQACDDARFPLFLALMLTGLRPGSCGTLCCWRTLADVMVPSLSTFWTRGSTGAGSAAS